MTILLSAIVTLVVVLAITYHKKKNEEEMYEKLTYSPEQETPYPRGFGEIIVDYQYALFDQFVKSTWPCDFLSWECKLERLTRSYLGNHLIVVRHTDGTYHEEVIKVSQDTSGDGDSSIGSVYKFEVLAKGANHQKPKKDEEPKNPEPKKPEEPKPEAPNDEPKKPGKDKTAFEKAADWVEAHRPWLIQKVDSEGWFVVRTGNGENDIEESLLGEVYKILEGLDNDFQVQLGDGCVEICPLPEY